MIVAIHQPNLFPRLKTLQKLALADVWIVLDDVQYCQREYQNRAYIVPMKGDRYWCTIPVKLCNGQKTKIKDVDFACHDPSKIIKNTLTYSYKSTNENKQIFNNILSNMERKSGEGFTEFIVESAISMLDFADLTPKVIYSSTLNDNTLGKTEKLIALCNAINADTYIADSGGAHYINESMFEQANINVLWHVWEAPNQTKLSILGDAIRNGTSLNVLARSFEDYLSIISQCKISKKRYLAEGR